MKYEIKTFKDEQISAKVEGRGNLDVKLRGSSYSDLFKAAALKDAWDSQGIENKGAWSKLTIYCLIGQRSDRRFEPNNSFDLKTIANFINSMKYDEVNLFHPHSDVSLALIDNSKRISHLPFVEKVYKELNHPILVSPDAGAFKASYEIAQKLGADLVPSNKVRINEEPLIKIQGDVKNRDCLIIDDLADGGRTFINLAKELKSQGAEKVFLYVSHGQFHYGFEEIKEWIDHVYCTNSYRDIENEFVSQFKVI